MPNPITLFLQLIFFWPAMVFEGTIGIGLTGVWWVLVIFLIHIGWGKLMLMSDRPGKINWIEAITPGEWVEKVDLWRTAKGIPKAARNIVLAFLVLLFGIWFIDFMKGGKVNPINEKYEQATAEPEPEPEAELTEIPKEGDVKPLGSAQQASPAPPGVSVRESPEGGGYLIEITARPPRKSEITAVSVSIPKGLQDVASPGPPIGWAMRPNYNQYGELDSIEWRGSGIEPGRHESFFIQTDTAPRNGRVYKVTLRYANLNEEVFAVKVKWKNGVETG